MGNLLLFLRRNREWEGERDPGHVARAWNPGWQGWPFRVSKIKPMISLLLNVSGLPPTQRPGTRNYLCDCSLVKWITGQSWILTHELKTEESTCHKRWEEERRKKPWAFSSSYSQSPDIGRTGVSKGRYWSGHMHYRWIVGHKGLRLQSMFEDTEAQRGKWLGQGCSALWWKNWDQNSSFPPMWFHLLFCASTSVLNLTTGT